MKKWIKNINMAISKGILNTAHLNCILNAAHLSLFTETSQICMNGCQDVNGEKNINIFII